jgi:anti-anti-sigma factor
LLVTHLQTHVREVPRLVVIDLVGEITAFAEDELTRAYHQAAQRDAQHILLNFGDVDYLNSAGIATVIAIISQARQSGKRLMFTGLSSHYRLIFEIMGLTNYVPLFESEEAARESIGS